MLGNSFAAAEFAAMPTFSSSENVPGLTTIFTVTPSYFDEYPHTGETEVSVVAGITPVFKNFSYCFCDIVR